MYAETMLFIDDDQGKTMEPDVVLKQGMGADNDMNISAFDLL